MDQAFLYQVVISYVCLLFALCVHEAAHAVTAVWRGDPSPRLMGRTTLNPLAHIDPIGTVVMPLVMMVTGIPYLFGWAKPVAFNPVNLKNIRRDPVLIAIAGPLSNLLLALAAAVGLRIAFMFIGADLFLPGNAWGAVLTQLIIINLVLMLFNFIPVPPLDGHYVLHYFLPPSGQKVLESIGPFGIIIALIIGSRFLATPLFALFELVTSIALWGAH